MLVRICGPNINSGAQKRGYMHVHKDGCQDLKKYGPGKPLGGDVSGELEMLVNVNSKIGTVMEIYPDQIDEAMHDDTTREDVAADYLSDTYFAPCCDMLPVDEPVVPVYECWVANDAESFIKLNTVGEVRDWVNARFNKGLKLGAHVHVVVHNASEYTS